MGEMDFVDTQTVERERMTLFTFSDLCEGKRQKKKGLLFVFVFFFFFFFDKLVLFYYELVILGPYFRGYKFLWKKDLGLI
jgi:hypothetical protein